MLSSTHFRQLTVENIRAVHNACWLITVLKVLKINKTHSLQTVLSDLPENLFLTTYDHERKKI